MIASRSLVAALAVGGTLAACDFGTEATPDAGADSPCPTWFQDLDGDGHGGNVQVAACTQPDGFVASSDDCDDASRDKFPGNPEVCDLLDNDCEPNTAESCPTGCDVEVRDGGSRYLICLTDRTADAARTLCNTHGYQLVRVDDEDENNYINVTLDNREPPPPSVYLGGTDGGATGEGAWQWPDGVRFWNGGPGGAAPAGVFARWEPSSPDNGGSTPSENCMVQLNANAKWADVPCDRTLPFVCERALAK